MTVQELRRVEAEYCRRNPVYFVESYVHIEDKDAAELIQPFRLWDGQKRALETFANERLVVVLKARQLGFTWLALAEASRLLVLNTGRTVVGLSRSEEEAKELVRRLGVILRYMPAFVAEEGSVPEGWSGPVFKQASLELKIRWPDGPESVFKAFASSPAAGRSFTADLIVIDEWAFQQCADDIWQAAFPVINRPTGGRVIGLSTIKRGTLFEEIYTNPDNGFAKLFLPWSADPRRDKAWYRRTIGALGMDKTFEEYPESVEQALEVPGGAFFPEVKRETHWVDAPPAGVSRRYCVLDYGLDMLSVHWVSIAPDGRACVYKEYNEAGLSIGAAAETVLKLSRDEGVDLFLAPSDLWGRSQESGKVRAQLFAEAGLQLVQVSRDFPAGCAAMKEWLRVDPATGVPMLTIANCPTLLKCLQKIQKDERKPDVYAKEPHHLTHSVDSLRYFCIWWTLPPDRAPKKGGRRWTEDMWEDWRGANARQRAYLIEKWGEPE